MRKTLLMILVAAALGAYVYFYEIQGGQQRQQEKAAAEKLISIEKDSINYIKISSVYSEFEFSKNTDGWEILKPVQTGADESNINTLLSGIVNAKKERSFMVPEEDRSGFGLNGRAIRIDLKTTNDNSSSLQFGDPSSIGSNVYVSAGDSLVHLVAASVKNNAQKSLFDWRDKNALHFDKETVRQIRYKSVKEDIDMVKNGSEWKIEKPLEVKADNSTVNGLLNKLNSAKVSAVVSEDGNRLKEYGLDKAAYSIELLLGPEKASKRILFSDLDGNRAYGKDESRKHVFQVDSLFMKPLRKTLFDFRDKSIVNFEPNLVTRIVSVYKGNQVEIHKDTSNTWYGKDSLKARNWRVTNLMSNLKGLKASSFQVPVQYKGLSHPSASLTLFSAENVIAKLAVTEKDTKTVYVKNEQTGLEAAVEAAEVEKLFPDHKDLFEQPKMEEIQ